MAPPLLLLHFGACLCGENTHVHLSHFCFAIRVEVCESAGLLGMDRSGSPEYYDYFLVVDFEATCDEDDRTFPNEIIEFPVVLLDCREKRIVGKFQSYVRPLIRPRLTSFCTQLTGIRQDDVDRAPTLDEVFVLFEAWFGEHVPFGAKVIVATDGPSDIRHFLHHCAAVRDGFLCPDLFYRYIDVRATYSHYIQSAKHMRLATMLRRVRLPFVGRAHSGIVDATNIARLVLEMFRRGCRFHKFSVVPRDKWATKFPSDATVAVMQMRQYEKEKKTHWKYMNNVAVGVATAAAVVMAGAAVHMLSY